MHVKQAGCQSAEPLKQDRLALVRLVLKPVSTSGHCLHQWECNQITFWQLYQEFCLESPVNWHQCLIYYNGAVAHFIGVALSFNTSFPGGSDGKESAYSGRDLGSIPRSGRSLGEGNGNPLQSSCLENPMDRKSLASYCPWAHESRTWLRLTL